VSCLSKSLQEEISADEVDSFLDSHRLHLDMASDTDKDKDKEEVVRQEGDNPLSCKEMTL
jgi:hypothetical protein